ncbi:MAG: hypothetical protein KAY22_08050 [Rhizorhabdus sp.]|uniref:hypothetical protein n=1 Tax=Rhizorhabdus sp. TaxID=1968843 RepID=UPI001B6B584D|nr:hypothetical protein [Rhizorhabdus sp.]MBP8232240.1 hypothetical protein [Rhizorhabdus sp.]
MAASPPKQSAPKDADLLSRLVPELDLTWHADATTAAPAFPLRIPLPSDLAEPDRAKHDELLVAVRSALITWPHAALSEISLQTRAAMEAELRSSADWRRLDLGVEILREVGRCYRRQGNNDIRLELPAGRRPQPATTARIGLERELAVVFTDFAAASTRIIEYLGANGSLATVQALTDRPGAFGRVRRIWLSAWTRGGWPPNELERIVGDYLEAAGAGE